MTRPPLWTHQREAIDFAKARNMRMLLNAWMGTGKTLAAVTFAEETERKRVIVCTAKAVIPTWMDHFEDSPLRAATPRGSNAEKKAEYLAAQKPDVVVTNYETAWREPLGSWLARWGADALILDESQRIKGHISEVSYFFYRLATGRHKANRGYAIPARLLLTGTPMPHSPLDIYAQFRVLEPDVFGLSYTRFRARYAVMGGFEGRKVVGFQREGELQEQMNQLTFSVDRDVLDLLPARDQRITCELAPVALKAYTEMELLARTKIEGGEITAANGAVKLMRLRQIVNGAADKLYNSNGKLEALEELLREMRAEERAVVFCEFTADIAAVRAVADKLGRASFELSGARKDQRTWAKVAGGVIAVQIKAGGIGVDLTASRYAIFFSHPWSPGDYDQARSRVLRPGQDKGVVFYSLICRNTVDEVVLGALKRRERVIDRVIERLGGNVPAQGG